MGVASLQEKGCLVTPKLPFQALLPCSLPLARKDCSTRFCSTGVCFCEPQREPGLRGCCEPSFRGLLQSRKVCFCRLFENSILVLFLLQEVAFAEVFRILKTSFLRAKHNAALEAIRNCRNSPEGPPRHMRAREHQDEDQVAQHSGCSLRLVCA